MPSHLPVVAVVGAGTMGAGIAQVALEAGHPVRIYDPAEGAGDRARLRIADGLARRAAKLDMDADSIDGWVEGRMSGLASSTDLQDLMPADLVIEAALEDLPLKQRLFRELDRVADVETVLATNTSALSVAAIASATAQPERVLGLHFFNPAPVMRLVEVVSPEETDPLVVERAMELVQVWGKTPIRSADSPGFIVNRVNRPFTLEALRILEEGGGTIEGIDSAVRVEGWPMGPFELMDLVGIDVNLAAARSIYEAFERADRFRPSPIQERLVDAGRLGRKTGQGYYRYGEGSRPLEPDDGLAEAHGEAALHDQAIVERIVLAIVNEAYLALGEGVAGSAEDIDTALRLGAGHPRGPLEQVDRLGGPSAVLDRLERLTNMHGSRFEAAPLLRRVVAGS